VNLSNDVVGSGARPEDCVMSDRARTLTQQIERLERVEELRAVQAELLTRLDRGGLQQFAELTAMQPQLTARRIELTEFKQALETSLHRAIDRRLATEGGPPRAVERRRAALRADAAQRPELVRVNAQLADLQAARDDYERLVAELERQLRAAMRLVPPHCPEVRSQRLGEIFNAVRTHNRGYAQRQIQALRGELHELAELSYAA